MRDQKPADGFTSFLRRQREETPVAGIKNPQVVFSKTLKKINELFFI